MGGNPERTRTIVAALRAVPIFATLTEAELEALAGQVVRRRVSRNEVIFGQGDAGDGLYVVVSGHVGINRQGSDGNELLLALCEPGEYFGDLALVDGAPRSATAVAFEDCALLFLGSAAFRSVLEAHPAALWRCLQGVIGQLRRLTEVADDIALVDVRHRLAHRLLRLADQGLLEVQGNGAAAVRRPVRITQQQLADMTGATRERVNKQLQAFEAEGLIALKQGRVRIVDPAGLKACDDS